MPRNPSAAPLRMADALLRTAGGATAFLRMAPASTDSAASELGLVATNFSEVTLSPAVLRKLQPRWEQDGQPQWELLVSAKSVQQQVQSLNLASAQALFAAALAVTVAGQDYLIESIAANEAFGQVYIYRLLLREAREQAL